MNLAVANQNERCILWTGILEWHEKIKGPPEGQIMPRQIPSQISVDIVNSEPEVKAVGWPPVLIMQLIPKALVANLGGGYFTSVKTVLVMLQNCEALSNLTYMMDSGFAGCVHFIGMHQIPCNVKVLILLYSKDHGYLGFIPGDQAGFVDRIRQVIHEKKTQHTHQTIMQRGLGFSGASVVTQHQTITQQLLVPIDAIVNTHAERHVIWTGTMEWFEKRKGDLESQNTPKRILAQVSAAVVNGELEVKGDGWPQQLVMQLIPKCIVGKLGTDFFRNARTVLFVFQNCPDLSSLTRIMESGYAGCVHFVGLQHASANLKVAILLYSKERHAYLGFIPNDQEGLVKRIREVVQQQKALYQQAALMSQDQGMALQLQDPIQQPQTSQMAQISFQPAMSAQGPLQPVMMLSLTQHFEQTLSLTPSTSALAQQLADVQLQQQVPIAQGGFPVPIQGAASAESEIDLIELELSLMEL